MDNNCTLLSDENLQLLKRLSQHFQEEVSDEDLVKEEVVDRLVRKFFDNIAKMPIDYSPSEVNGLYQKLTKKDHPSFEHFLSYSSTYYGT